MMAPMIETPFAMDKFRGAVNKLYGGKSNIERIINAETITCLHDFDGILERGSSFLTGVTVGRSDLSASMGIAKKRILRVKRYTLPRKSFAKRQRLWV